MRGTARRGRLASAVPARAQIIDAVFATVLVTLVAQGIPLKHVLARLYPEGHGTAR
jgi:NhaP-type Na+/H+ or K+/H+ antiporter